MQSTACAVLSQLHICSIVEESRGELVPTLDFYLPSREDSLITRFLSYKSLFLINNHY